MSFNYEERIKILNYWNKHGLTATIDAIRLSDKGETLSRATLFRWKKVWKRSQGLGPSSGGGKDSLPSDKHNYTLQRELAPKSTKPRTYRSSSIPGVYNTLIKLIRKKRFGVGKMKLATILNKANTDIVYAVELSLEYCGNSKGLNVFGLGSGTRTKAKAGLSSPSPSTIGRVIHSLKQQRAIMQNAKEYNKYKQVYLDGGTGTIKYRKVQDRNKLYGVRKTRRPSEYKPSQIGQYIQLDAVTIQTPVLDCTTGAVKTKKIYFICGIDTVTRIAFAKRYDSLNSQSTTDFLHYFKLNLAHHTRTQINQIKIQNIQTDNGQENHKHFTKHLADNNITQFWSYPRSPKMNAFVEKFNHSVQAECLEYHLHHLRQGNYLRYDQLLHEWINWYNAKRCHTSLQYLSPVEFYNQQFLDQKVS